MPTIYIDDKAFEVDDGDNVLQAVLSLGLDLPYFCWHPAMGSVGACRQCALVQFRDEEDTRGRIVMGCMTPVVDGARFSMQGPVASNFRKNIVESLMLNHPHDCPVCAEGGECHLQDMTMMAGHRNRSYRGKKNTHRNQYLGPLIQHEMNRCIACYRCTRFYSDYAGGTDLAAHAAHDHVYFGRHKDGVLESEFAGNLVEVCPTGVFTDKPLVKQYTRKWDLQSAPSVCTGCAVGCNITPGERYGKLKRVHNRFNSEVNGYFLCDRGRFGGSYVNDQQRPSFAGQRDSDGRYNAIESITAINQVTATLQDQTVIGIGSPRASLESNALLRELVSEANFCSGIDDHQQALLRRISSIITGQGVLNPSLQQIEAADAVLILGEDVSNTAPRVALSLRQSVRNLGKAMAAEMRIPEWQDEAVRNLAQDQRSPLFIVAPCETRLDDIAATRISMTPEQIAQFGSAIVHALDSSQPMAENLEQSLIDHAETIATALKSAKRPLIVGGTSLQSGAIVDAAANIAACLSQTEKMLSYCLAEANSLGQSLLCAESTLSFERVFEQVESGAVKTLIVLENDLFRRTSRGKVDALLSKLDQLIVLDSQVTATLERADLAIPTATSFECEGTLVSSEARAQRHYPVFQPAEQRQAAWRWLRAIGQQLGHAAFVDLHEFDDVTEMIAANSASLRNITAASPDAEFRDRGMKIPRQPHRYSGRTAMRADISVHEPKQSEDPETPFSYSMEGANSGKSGALIPFVWSPGWNSNQALHKFQAEAGGKLKGGTPGVRLQEPDENAKLALHASAFTNQATTESGLRLFAAPRIFGSDELSARAPAIAELTPQPFILISTQDAQRLDLNDGDIAELTVDDQAIELEVQLSTHVVAGSAGYCSGLPNVPWLPIDAVSEITKLRAKPAASSLMVEPGVINE